MVITDKLITWLNGRLISNLVITDGQGNDVTIWTLKQAQEDGLTIEDSINNYVLKNNIDIDEEIEQVRFISDAVKEKHGKR